MVVDEILSDYFIRVHFSKDLSQFFEWGHGTLCQASQLQHQREPGEALHEYQLSIFHKTANSLFRYLHPRGTAPLVINVACPHKDSPSTLKMHWSLASAPASAYSQGRLICQLCGVNRPHSLTDLVHDIKDSKKPVKCENLVQRSKQTLTKINYFNHFKFLITK